MAAIEDWTQIEYHLKEQRTATANAKRFAVCASQMQAQSITHTVVYTYNGDGVRRAMAVDGLVTYWTQILASHCTSYNRLSNMGCGLPQVLVESTGTENTLYMYGLSRLAQIRGIDVQWFLGDALDSVRQLVDDDSAVILTRDYDPYGQILSESGTGSSGYAFAGEQWDSSLNMIFLRARWYDVRTGRFVSQDPWSGSIRQSATLHKYVYALGNP